MDVNGMVVLVMNNSCPYCNIAGSRLNINMLYVWHTIGDGIKSSMCSFHSQSGSS